MHGQHPIKLLKITLICTFALTIAGCSTTPNVTGFAEGTANLYAASAGELRSVSEKFDRVIELSESARKKKFSKQKKSFEVGQKAINEILQQAVTYSNELVALAESGETGGTAAKALGDSLNGFVQLAGGPAAIVSGTVAKILEKVGEVVTRVQAQRSLRAAVAQAQEGVTLVADALACLYGEVTKQSGCNVVMRFSDVLSSEEKDILRNNAGKNLIGFYELAQKRRNKNYARLQRILSKLDGSDIGFSGLCVDAGGAPDSSCFIKQEVEAVAVIDARVQAIEPIYRAYRQDVDTVNTWRRKRVQSAKILVAASRAWALEHGKIAKALGRNTDFTSWNLRAVLLGLKTGF